MKLSRILIAVVISAVFAGCAPKRHNLQPVDSPPKTIVQNGFSFLPLDEKGWYILGRMPHAVALAREGTSTDETHAIQGKLFKFPTFASDEAFVRAVKKGQANDTDIANPDRYRTLTHVVALYEHRGEPCAFSHIVTEDHGAKKRTDTPGLMILDVYALVCRHPQNRNAAISFSYSQRYYPENRNENIASKARQLIDSLGFTTLQ
ncbi:hypothetical protein Ga0123461_2015 [Mariprofundus aestuarium]|uniref:Lipoprotein n=1 Tax=Mariprofundus aestuarium TaxID=1921086 RepID=A0A2K8L3L1_MARES|nr:hypothetical protein [Mariprofundus aestuarium]ATX80421.1 hypothetical protein Ga0123461_2015 [Mariprofundus aestuarium]